MVTDKELHLNGVTRSKLHLPAKKDTLDRVKFWHYLVLAVLILAIVYACLHRQELGLTGMRSPVAPDNSNSGSPTPNARSARFNWRIVDRTRDGFKVDMPDEVRETQVPAYNETGSTEPVRMIYANPDSQVTYAVSWADNPPVARVGDSSADRILDRAREDALARTQTFLVTESRITPDGYPAREFIGRNAGGGILNARLIYAAPRLYMLATAFPSESARRDQDVARFFNSFTVESPSRIPEGVPAASGMRN